jgi:hypothetical protein
VRERAAMLEALEGLGWPCRLVELPQAYKDLHTALLKSQEQVERLRRPLLSFIETIDATGGVGADLSPVADEDWLDLGEAYAEACSALEVPMKQLPADDK